MNDKQLKLLNYVITMHGGQPRKYNMEPYWMHTYRVGFMAQEHGVRLGLEKGLVHDLVEDVKGLSFPAVTKVLQDFGYNKSDADEIVMCLYNLTDLYTSELYPDLNRKSRKVLEAHRLWEIRPEDQTVKYCDLIDNTSTIVPYDKDFAKVYLAEKRYILLKMDKGNPELFNKCKQLANERNS